MADSAEKDSVHPVQMILTQSDNTTHDLIRWGGAAGIFFFIIFTGYIVIHNNTFDGVTYGTGLMALLGGIGGALRLKKSVDEIAPAE